METELKLAIWQIANAALDMYEDKLNGKEFEELAFNALKQVKNLNIPCVNIAKRTVSMMDLMTFYSNSKHTFNDSVEDVIADMLTEC
jgi:hypothetical protein